MISHCSSLISYAKEIGVQQEVELGESVLKGVSRSFYLSIRLLPRLMREPVSIAYLLARASDTLADTAAVPAKLRIECLELFHDSLSDEQKRNKMLALIQDKFTAYQENEKEKLLLECLGDVFAWYETVREWAWHEISKVLVPIIEGQIWDVNYFAIEGKKQVENDEVLDRYCYQVAGSVGEFWGCVGKGAYKRFSEYTDDILDIRGMRYGKGLQLVNILRDLPEDLANGRCYIPGIDTSDKDQLVKLTKKYRIQARTYLEQGTQYASALRQKRSRIATVLPALIGIKTLDLLEDVSWEEWENGVKISRKEMRKCFWKSIWH